jgi:hypothetical protein
MLSADAEFTAGTGDPDSDVPPELFNDLEGKLDTKFASARSNVAPNPNDMEPEESRDDFQIEQTLEAPSARLDKVSLDILHAEAEYFSGEKPPAAAKEEAETLETAPTDTLIEDIQDLSDEGTYSDEDDEIVLEAEQPFEPVEEQPVEPEERDDLDEINRRIRDLEIDEEPTEISEVSPEPDIEEQQADALDDLISAEFSGSAIDENLATAEAAADDAPFENPEIIVPEEDELSTHPVDDLYEENIPLEEDASPTPVEDKSIDEFIDTLVAEQVIAATTESRPRRKVSARRFPNIDDTSDELYGASQDRSDALKDMLPDIDELSSEIAHDAEHGTRKHAQDTEKSAKSGFVKGFKYAILLYIIIGILYFLKPFIVEYIPQAEGFLNLVSNFVDAMSNLVAMIFDKIKGMMS